MRGAHLPFRLASGGSTHTRKKLTGPTLAVLGSAKGGGRGPAEGKAKAKDTGQGTHEPSRARATATATANVQAEGPARATAQGKHLRDSLAQRLPLGQGQGGLAKATEKEKLKAAGTGKKEAACSELTTLGYQVCLGYASQLVDEVRA